MIVRYSIKTGVGFQVFDGFVDVVLLCDIVVNFKTSFIKQSGTLESDPKVVSS